MLLDTVENAVWAKDGKNARKPVYVVYGTECPISHDLYRRARAFGDQVQFRWIPANGGAAAATVVARRDAASVGSSFSGGAGQAAGDPAAQRGAAYNAMIGDSLTYQLRDLDRSTTFAYPTLIYRTASGVKVVAGIPADLASLPGEVLDQPEKSGLVPAALGITTSALQVTPSRNLAQWGPSAGPPAVFRAAPSPRAAPVFELDADHVMQVSGIVADGGWIEVGLAGQKAYTHDPLMARMALLEYRIQPGSGQVSIRTPTPVREFPHADAPVVAQIPAGRSYARTGTVELDGTTWDRIAFYKGGIPAYIPR